MGSLVKALLVALGVEGIKATKDMVCLFWKNWRAKKSNSTQGQLSEAIQKHFGIEQEAALRVIDSLLQKKVIRMRRAVVKGQSVSVKATDGKFSMEDGSALRTPKASIVVGKKKDNNNNDDDDPHFGLEGGTVEITDEGGVELEL